MGLNVMAPFTRLFMTMNIWRWKQYFILSVSLCAAAMTLHSTLLGFDGYQHRLAFSESSRMRAREESYVTKPPKNYEDTGYANPAYVPYSFVKANWRPAISPYEYRWPGERLSRWAHKREGTIIQHLPPDDKMVCFAHIGKTGGSSLGCSLGFSLHCPRDPAQLYVPPGLLPLYTTNILHNDVNDCPDNAPYYLFGLRDPLERVQSAYIYDRRSVEEREDDDNGQNALYVECPFYTLNDLALRGLAKTGNAPDFCKKRAYNAIRGIKRHGYHLYYNHEHFLNETKALDSKILVIRTNHMKDDWNAAEVALGGKNDVADNFPHANKGDTSNLLFDDNHLSLKAREVLCEALCEEIQWYKKIIENAVNLSPDDKAKSIGEISCPVQARAKKCRRL